MTVTRRKRKFLLCCGRDTVIDTTRPGSPVEFGQRKYKKPSLWSRIRAYIYDRFPAIVHITVRKPWRSSKVGSSDIVLQKDFALPPFSKRHKYSIFATPELSVISERPNKKSDSNSASLRSTESKKGSVCISEINLDTDTHSKTATIKHVVHEDKSDRFNGHEIKLNERKNRQRPKLVPLKPGEFSNSSQKTNDSSSDEAVRMKKLREKMSTKNQIEFLPQKIDKKFDFKAIDSLSVAEKRDKSTNKLKLTKNVEAKPMPTTIRKADKQTNMPTKQQSNLMKVIKEKEPMQDMVEKIPTNINKESCIAHKPPVYPKKRQRPVALKTQKRPIYIDELVRVPHYQPVYVKKQPPPIYIEPKDTTVYEYETTDDEMDVCEVPKLIKLNTGIPKPDILTTVSGKVASPHHQPVGVKKQQSPIYTEPMDVNVCEYETTDDEMNVCELPKPTKLNTGIIPKSNVSTAVSLASSHHQSVCVKKQHPAIDTEPMDTMVYEYETTDDEMDVCELPKPTKLNTGTISKSDVSTTVSLASPHHQPGCVKKQQPLVYTEPMDITVNEYETTDDEMDVCELPKPTKLNTGTISKSDVSTTVSYKINKKLEESVKEHRQVDTQIDKCLDRADKSSKEYKTNDLIIDIDSFLGGMQPQSVPMRPRETTHKPQSVPLKQREKTHQPNSAPLRPRKRVHQPQSVPLRPRKKTCASNPVTLNKKNMPELCQHKQENLDYTPKKMSNDKLKAGIGDRHLPKLAPIKSISDKDQQSVNAEENLAFFRNIAKHPEFFQSGKSDEETKLSRCYFKESPLGASDQLPGRHHSKGNENMQFFLRVSKNPHTFYA